jgi:hypothetical protein
VDDAAGAIDDEGTRQALRAALGTEFTDWVLASNEGSLSAQQREVAGALLGACAASGLENDGGMPRRLLITGLLTYDEQRKTSVLNALRAHSGGRTPGPSDLVPTGDATLDALAPLAIESYGELLLADDFTGLTGLLSSPASKAAQAVVTRDPRLPFSDGDSDDKSILVLRSTGSGGGLQLWGVAPSIVGAAFDAVTLRGDRPSLDALLRELPTTLEMARRAFAGEPATTLGVASLTGVLLPEGHDLRFPWGRLRPARPEDHPDWIPRSLGERHTSRQSDGTEVVINDAGDVILEADVPFRVEQRDGLNEQEGFPDLSSSDDLEKRITQVRLAHLLASSGTHAPVLVPVWRRFSNLWPKDVVWGGVIRSTSRFVRPRSSTNSNAPSGPAG